MITDPALVSRLHNWKFEDAWGLLLRQPLLAPDDELPVVRALSRVFGNAGWFDGDMGTLVAAVVSRLVDQPEQPAAQPQPKGP
jgi:hypothetical protein